MRCGARWGNRKCDVGVEKAKASGKYANNMGAVRYYLAMCVITAHFNLVYGTDFAMPTSSYNAVGGFFALSGFLVYKSWLSSGGIRPYLLRRARRILPPYLFIVLLCAFGLVAFSTLSWKEYFFNIDWLKYVVSNAVFLNFLEPELPGVFQSLPVHAVNGSLWTIKIEVLLYISIPIFSAIIAMLHKKRGNSLRNVVWTVVGIYVMSMAYRLCFSHLYLTTDKEIYNILSRQVFGQLMYFYTGVLIYFVHDFFMKHRIGIAIIVLLIVLTASNMPYYEIIISPLVVSTATLLFSFAGNFGFLQKLNVNNVSYDMYLYHMPILLVSLQCGWFEGCSAIARLSLITCAVTAVSCFSWFAIGKRFLYR